MKKEVLTYKRVWICWDDSTSWKRVWWNIRDLFEDLEDNEKGDYIYTTAYLFHKTKRHYYLANSIHFEDGKAVSFAQVFTIPVGCVIKMKNI